MKATELSRFLCSVFLVVALCILGCGSDDLEETRAPHYLLYSIWAADESEIYVGGRYDNDAVMIGGTGAQWGQIWESPGEFEMQDPPFFYVVYDIWGSDDGVIFGVGGPSAAVMKSDGVWQVQFDHESRPDINHTLYGVFGFSDNDVFAVGSSSTVVHYDGSDWRKMDIDLDGTYSLLGVWGAASNDVYVVGSDSVVIHYDGDTWTRLSVPTNEHLNRIWGRASNDIYVVGQNGSILHYDGADWLIDGSFDGVTLFNVFGVESEGVYAVGLEGDCGVFLERNEDTWTRTADFPGFRFMSIWSSSQSDIYICGNSLRSDGAEAVVYRFDGDSWSEVYRRGPSTDKAHMTVP